MSNTLLIRIIGVISVLLALLAIGFILSITKRDLTKSVSHHAAISVRNHLVFCLIMTASLVGLTVFIYTRLIPHYHLSWIFSLLVGVALTLEFATTWVRLTTGWRKLVHDICSYGTAVLLPILLVIVLFSPNITIISFFICLIAILLMLLFLYLFLFVKATHSRYLIFQTSYVMLFYLSILALITIL